MRFTQKRLGDMSGAEVRSCEITNEAGAVFSFTNLGANILSLLVPDRNGRFDDVVLGYPSWQDYTKYSRNMAGVGGRFCGRIADARFNLGGQEYRLVANNGPNHLHGGQGFHTKLWEVRRMWERNDAIYVELFYLSPDGEDNYPGDLSLWATYSFNELNQVTMQYKAETTKLTVVNPMNHWYLNLGGHASGSVNHHMAHINASRFAEVRAGLIPTGNFLVVDGTPFDLTTPRTIGLVADLEHPQLDLVGGFDHSYLLPKPWTSDQVRAEAYDPQSGRTVKVQTTEPSVHFFTANENLAGVDGKGGVCYGRRPGFCFEAQHFPNSPNEPKFPPVTLWPTQEFKSTTIYTFGTR